MKIKTLCLICVLTLAFGASAAQAGMIHFPTAYGLSARSIGMGNATTALVEDLALPYFNPASMAKTNESKLGLTYIFAQPNFEGGLKDGNRDEFDTPNRILSTSIIVAMDEFLKSNRKIALGLNVSLDDNGKGFIQFDDLIQDNGDYFRYGEGSFVLNAGLGFEIVEWFYFGGGVLTTLHSNADFYTDTDLAGNTSKEGVTMDVNILFAPLVSLFLRFDPVSIGLAYRGESHGELAPINTEANNVVGGSQLVELPLELLFKDAFIPANISLGLAWDITPNVTLALQGDWYQWGRFDEEMTDNDLVRENTAFDFTDTYVPRIGVDYQVVENLYLRGGYFFEQSPVKKPGSNGNYLLDNDKHVGSMGLGYDLDLGIVNYTISLDAAFFHHYLAPRDLKSSDGTTLRSEGNLSGGTISAALRF